MWANVVRPFLRHAELGGKRGGLHISWISPIRGCQIISNACKNLFVFLIGRLYCLAPSGQVPVSLSLRGCRCLLAMLPSYPPRKLQAPSSKLQQIRCSNCYQVPLPPDHSASSDGNPWCMQQHDLRFWNVGNAGRKQSGRSRKFVHDFSTCAIRPRDQGPRCQQWRDLVRCFPPILLTLS